MLVLILGHDVLNRFIQRGTILFIAQAKVHVGRDIAAGIAQIMALSLVDYHVDGLAFLNEELDGVSKLQLAALARLNTAQGIKDLAVQR